MGTAGEDADGGGLDPGEVSCQVVAHQHTLHMPTACSDDKNINEKQLTIIFILN